MADGRRTRERLIHAAAAAFWTKGFDGTSIAEVALAAGVPAGNVFHHFRTKADLAAAVAALFVSETTAALAGIAGRVAAPEARIAAFFDLLDESTASRVARGCPIARAAREFPAAAPPARGAAEAFAVMIAWLAGEMDAAGVGDGSAAARAVIARWQGAIVLAASLGDAAILGEAIAALRRQFGPADAA